MAGLGRKLIGPFVFLNELCADAAELVMGDLTAALNQTKLVLQLLIFGCQIARHGRLLLVMLRSHLLKLLFQSRDLALRMFRVLALGFKLDGELGDLLLVRASLSRRVTLLTLQSLNFCSHVRQCTLVLCFRQVAHSR